MRMKNISYRGFAAIIAAALAACGGHSGLSQSVIPPAGAGSSYLSPAEMPSPIKHIVIIFQENRTPDYLFQGIPGADISKTGKTSRGEIVRLHEVSLAAGYDLGHGHSSFVQDYDDGKMDGFDKGLPQRFRFRPFGYAPESEVQPYHDMARQYVLADHMFQSDQAPSFPAHLYIVSGTAGDESIQPNKVVGNPHDRLTGEPAKAGCDAHRTTFVDTINPQTGNPGPQPWPCFDRPVLPDFLVPKGISWRYYQNHASAGIWHAFDAIRHIRFSEQYENVIVGSPKVIKDIRQNRLAGVSWVMPGDPWSDHAGRVSTTQGPAWVAAIVNAIGQSQFWDTTAIFVTWDDWGGWYDHVTPPIRNYNELGCRVPLIVISPYARHGYVSKVQHEFGSILAFAEETFGIPKGSLKSTDANADDLSDAFDFSQKPRAFKHINAPPFRGSGSEIDSEDP
jgi:phospholipase C